MNYVFGPVPSRRLGQSLGIDTIPLKTCNWNCVYCQLGRTKPLVNQRKTYFPPQEIVRQAQEALTIHKPDDIDWITFVGSGEPTLHAEFGWLVRQVKALSDIPVAVITNGSLLYLPQVREDLAAADAVLPTLDAGSADLYRKINRPHPEATFERLVEGLTDFRADYGGKLWIEIMLVQGLNDSEEALQHIAAVLRQIGPDAVHISLPTRPPAETWVRPPSEAGLMRATAILGDTAQVIHPAEGDFDLSGYTSLTDAIIDIVTRHPMRQEELERTLAKWAPEQTQQALDDLQSSRKVQVVTRYGTRFLSATPSHYPDESHSQPTAPDHSRKHSRSRPQ